MYVSPKFGHFTSGNIRRKHVLYTYASILCDIAGVGEFGEKTFKVLKLLLNQSVIFCAHIASLPLHLAFSIFWYILRPFSIRPFTTFALILLQIKRFFLAKLIGSGVEWLVQFQHDVSRYLNSEISVSSKFSCDFSQN